jgi:hypothetical protein
MAKTYCSSPLFKPAVQTRCSNPLLKPAVQTRCSNPLLKPAAQTRCSNPLFKPAAQTRCSSLIVPRNQAANTPQGWNFRALGIGVGDSAGLKSGEFI